MHIFWKNKLRLGSRKRVFLIFCLPAVAVALWVLLVVNPGDAAPRLKMGDGTDIAFLGSTSGTNHWHPNIPAFQLRLYQLQARSKFGRVAALMLPKTNHNAPMIVTTPQPVTVLWFHSTNISQSSLYAVVRLLNYRNEEYGRCYNLKFSRSGTAALPLFPGLVDLGTAPTGLRIYERSSPISDEIIPESLIDLYLQKEVGRFQLSSEPAQ